MRIEKILKIKIELVENGVVTLADAFHFIKNFIDKTRVTGEDFLKSQSPLQFVDFFINIFIFKAGRTR